MTYAIPPLAEIEASAGTNGLTAVSTFSGCGGSSLGLRWAGWSVPYASEFIPAARETYLANSPETTVDGGDIRDLTAETLLEHLGLDVGDLDLLEGSPPCSPFSLSGKRAAGWNAPKPYSETVQRVDDLFDEWLRLADGLRPRALLAENVPSLATGKTAGAWKILAAEIRALGYRVGARILDSSRLGVPQVRRRLIVVALRNDVDGDLVWPRPRRDLVALRDAIDLDDDPDGIDPETGDEISIRRFAIYREWARLGYGQGGTKYLNLTRPAPWRPCPTITQTAGAVGAAGVCHPTQPRKFTAAELRRLGGFPDDFTLTGTYRQRAERIGRAVTPPVYRAVGAALADVLTKDR